MVFVGPVLALRVNELAWDVKGFGISREVYSQGGVWAKGGRFGGRDSGAVS